MTRSSLRRWAGPAVAGSLALVGSVLPVLGGTAQAAVPGSDSPVFINEIHYDNDGIDTGEFVEVRVPAGTDATQWSLVLYNGNAPSAAVTYGTARSLPAAPAAGGLLVLDYPRDGLQNGGSDGVALVGPDGVAQLLSYEGVFTASNGPAAGMTSTDIGVAETSTTPVGHSLQLTGSGSSYRAFSWTGPAGATQGTVNTGQTFTAENGPGAPLVDCPASLAAVQGEATSAQVSATDADSGITSLAITSAAVDGITLEGSTAPTGPAQAAAATLTVAATTAAGTYAVDITATSDDDARAVCTVAVTVAEPLATTLVSTVQGSGATSPLTGQEVRVEAVVTSLITSRDVLDGFFVQEQDADADTDATTSEGIYVFCRASCPSDLAAGDLVEVVGTVGEFRTNTQIDATRGSVTVVAADLPLPRAAVVTLPADGSTKDPATFEHVEGMRTTIATTLAVSEYFNLARYGQIVLTAGEREHQYTQTNAPSVAGYEAFLADLATRRIVLDDDSNDQNDATSGPLDDEPYPYPTGGLSTENLFRGGDTITGLTGVMEYNQLDAAWRLRPVPGQDYTFESAPRPATPDDVGGRLQVASFNVLNSFATIDTTSSNTSGPCAPSGTQDCRGADSEQERQRQLAKTVAALQAIDADVLGLIEIQNDDGLATRQIVDALNAATAPGTYAAVDTGVIGTDAIKQALLYKTATVTPVGEFALLTEEDDPRFDDDRNRPALIQTFEEVATGERFTVAVNHLKSKGSGCGAGDDSRGDGSGNCDLTRTQAAAALADHLATDPTGSGDPDFLIIGDLNSYSMERPVTTLETAGYVDLLERFEGLESYGYVFDGLLGHLDHALATESLASQVTGAGGWKINADEVPLFDYNDTVRDSGESAFERESSALPLYEPDPYRSSDHDPVIVGLSLDTAPTADAGGPYTVKPGARIVLDAAGSSDLEGDELTFAWDLDGDGQFDDATGPTAVFRANRPPGDHPVAVRVSDGSESSVAGTVVHVVPPGRQRR